jgi:hypothetical protein
MEEWREVTIFKMEEWREVAIFKMEEWVWIEFPVILQSSRRWMETTHGGSLHALLLAAYLMLFASRLSSHLSAQPGSFNASKALYSAPPGALLFLPTVLVSAGMSGRILVT